MKPINNFAFCIAFILCLGSTLTNAQVPAEPKVYEIKDSTYVFKPAKPLVTYQASKGQIKNAWGIDLLFSDNGFGMGAFYEKYFSDKLLGFFSLNMSGAHNTDEYEYYDQNTGAWIVPNKVNRLYMFPMMFGAQYFVMRDALAESFRPFVNIGVGPTYIVSTPYVKEWFNSFSYATSYVRMGGFIGIGSYFGSPVGPLIGVKMKYYYIPFGGNGLESIRNLPIKNFGGVFLSLSIGSSY